MLLVNYNFSYSYLFEVIQVDQNLGIYGNNFKNGTFI